MKMTVEEYRKIFEEDEIEEVPENWFNERLPEECRKCTLLEKDLVKVKARCIYRTKEGCML